METWGEDLRAWLFNNYPFDVNQITGPKLFSSLGFLSCPPFPWIETVPESVLDSFVYFFLELSLKSPHSSFDILFQDKVPLPERIRSFCTSMHSKRQDHKPECKDDIPTTKRCRTHKEEEEDEFVLPPYCPPCLDLKPPRLFPHLSLQIYLEKPLSVEHARFVWFDTRDALVLYDAFPKARFHFLILMRNANKVDLKTLAQQCVARIRSSAANKSVVFRTGFHALPSLTPAHLHVISHDLSRVKTKKHWNSFTHPKLWLPLGQENAVLSAIERFELVSCENSLPQHCPASTCTFRPSNTHASVKSTLTELIHHIEHCVLWRNIHDV